MAARSVKSVSRSSLGRLAKARLLSANTVNGPSSRSIFAMPLDCAAVTNMASERSDCAAVRRSCAGADVASRIASCVTAQPASSMIAAAILVILIVSSSIVQASFPRVHPLPQGRRFAGLQICVAQILDPNQVDAGLQFGGVQRCRAVLQSSHA